MTLLERISSPADLKKLSIGDLEPLACEMRQYIIDVVSQRGGHLASSLGAVEIALAVHYVFDSPRDRIVWDVGHQSYAHKIITGRREAFRELRTRKGISGFPNRFESECDSFGVGHASTAISAALGMAVSRDLRGEDHYCVSVVGDGALTGGLAFEGINQAGHLKRNRFIIILNDNEMSISRNVGALARYLTKITTKKIYLQFEADVWELLGRVPKAGGRARRLARRMKESIKNLVVPTILFEELGFRYFGPLDGHDLPLLVETLTEIRGVPGPVLLHVMTKKGKGYCFAEQNAEKFHGVGSFHAGTGGSRAAAGSPTYSDVFGAALIELARRDERVVAVTAAMTEGTGLAPFAREFPNRFFDVGIAEQHAVTFAAGLAREGFKPFVAIYSTFLQRAFDQLVHDTALQRLPVRFVLDRAGIVGEDGPTHHGAFDLSYLRCVPNMAVMAPRDAADLRGMLEAALAHESGPVAIRFPRGVAVSGDDGGRAPIAVGKGELLRVGGDAVIVAVGSMVVPSLEAAEALAKEGVSAAVIDARSVKPVDEDLIASAAAGGAPVLIVEESAVQGGFGEAVLDVLASRGLRNAVAAAGLPDRFVPHGRRDELLVELGLSPGGIAARVKALVGPRAGRAAGGDS